MNILVTTSLDLRQPPYGRAYRFVAHLVDRGHRVIVQCLGQRSASGGVSTQDRRLEKSLEKAEVRYLFTGHDPAYIQEPFSAFRPRPLAGDLKSVQFDAHLCLQTLGPGYSVATRLHSLGVPTIFDIDRYAVWPDDIQGQVPLPLKPLGGLYRSRMVSRNIEVARTVSVAGESLARRLKAPSSKLEIVPDGVDLSAHGFLPSAELRWNLGRASDFIIGYVGELNGEVDLRPVFAAVGKLCSSRPGLRMVVVGDGPAGGRSRSMALKYAPDDRIRFISVVPRHEWPRYMSSMDVSIVPYRKNRLTDTMPPVKLLEYMACRRPVISAPLEEVQNVGRGNVLYARTADEFAERICMLQDSPALRASMGVQGRKLVEEKYAWPVICMRMETILYEASRRPTSGAPVTGLGGGRYGR